MIVSKVGFHSIGSNRNGYGPCLHRIADAGRQVALIKCRDNFGAIDEPLALWPDTLTIGAMTEWDDADYNVDRAYKRIAEAARKNPKVKYWEYFNERDGDYKQQTDLYIALMPLLNLAGIGLCMFNSASGTPQYHYIDPAPYREVSRACAFAKAHGYKVILGLHEYQPSEGQAESDTLGRYQVLASYLQAQGALIPIAITEFGWEVCGNRTAQYLEWVKRIDRIYIGDDRLKGCALWTLGGGGWGLANYQNILLQLGDYIATVTAPVAPPEPPQPPQPITIEDRVTELERRVAALEGH